MRLLSPDVLPKHFPLIREIEEDMRTIYRMLVFTPELQAGTLLQRYFAAIQHLRDVLGFKNAQQEAQTEEEARDYLARLVEAMQIMVEEIRASVCIGNAVDLFRLFRAVAPEAAQRHPNRYRDTLVQVGSYIPPEPRHIPALVDELFEVLPEIPHPLIRAVWLHHELIRIHPFVDGNGRIGRMAENWLLMYELYPPVFIYGLSDRQRYIRYIDQSFQHMERDPDTFHPTTQVFFEDELRRVKASTGFLLARLLRDAEQDFGPEDRDLRPYV